MSTDTVTSPAAVKPMRADARRNYERLVTAARQVFADWGSEASMDEIAKAADVGVGTLYRHFPKRIDLVEAVYREDVDGLLELAERAEGDAWQGLVSWLQAFVRYAESKRTFLTELHEAFEKNPDFVLASREKLATATDLVLTRAQGAGVARDDIDHTDLMQLVGGMCMARNASFAQNSRLLELVLDGVRTQPAH
jgi:AcrR family transcriptional regulator